MLDPETPDERRDQISAETRQRVEAGGSLKDDRTWGMRKMAYEIRQRTEADYRFFRFETEGPLLEELDHNLKITDGVLRFRIFKVDPTSPVIEPPPPIAMPASSPRGGGGRRGGPGSRPPRGPAPDAEAPPTPAAEEAPAEQAPAEEPATEPPAEQPAREGEAASPEGETPAAEGDE